jgi:hypothetical protein
MKAKDGEEKEVLARRWRRDDVDGGMKGTRGYRDPHRMMDDLAEEEDGDGRAAATQQSAAESTIASVTGMLSDTLRKEGVRGLYRGVSAPLTVVSPMFAVNFWSYDMGQRMDDASPDCVRGLSIPRMHRRR